MAKWLIDQYILKDDNQSTIENVFKTNDIEYEILSYRPFVDDITTSFMKSENVIVYGSVGFVNKTQAYFGNYCNQKNLTFSNYISNVDIPRCNFFKQ